MEHAKEQNIIVKNGIIKKFITVLKILD